MTDRHPYRCAVQRTPAMIMEARLLDAEGTPAPGEQLYTVWASGVAEALARAREAALIWWDERREETRHA